MRLLYGAADTSAFNVRLPKVFAQLFDCCDFGLCGARIVVLRRPDGLSERSQVRRSKPPIASFAARHNMQMKMRHLLTTAHAVVLVQEDAARGEGLNKSFRKPLRG